MVLLGGCRGELLCKDDFLTFASLVVTEFFVVPCFTKGPVRNVADVICTVVSGLLMTLIASVDVALLLL